MGKVVWIMPDGYQRNLQEQSPPQDTIDKWCQGETTRVAVWYNDEWGVLFCAAKIGPGSSVNYLATDVAKKWPDGSDRMAGRKIYGPAVIIQGFPDVGMTQ